MHSATTSLLLHSAKTVGSYVAWQIQHCSYKAAACFVATNICRCERADLKLWERHRSFFFFAEHHICFEFLQSWGFVMTSKHFRHYSFFDAKSGSSVFDVTRRNIVARESTIQFSPTPRNTHFLQLLCKLFIGVCLSVAKSSVVPQRPSRLRDRWWWWYDISPLLTETTGFTGPMQSHRYTLPWKLRTEVTGIPVILGRSVGGQTQTVSTPSLYFSC